MRLAVLLFAMAAGMMQPAVNTIDQQTLKGYLENGAPFDFILIDARGADEISKAIGNSECKPYNLAWPEQFKDVSAKIPKDRTVIVYCRSGSRAARAATFLEASGYTRVYNAGGILTWTGPTVPASEIKPASLLPEPSCKSR
jgi:phage shock protein E